MKPNINTDSGNKPKNCNNKQIPKKHLYAAMVIIAVGVLFNLYNALTIHIHYDEAWTYFMFTKNGIWRSISYYPAPNNHIFHSLLTTFTTQLPLPLILGLRLPALTASLLASILFFYVSTKFFNIKTSLILLTLFVFWYPVSAYAFAARGYSLILLAFIICFYALLQIIYSEPKYFYRYLLLFSFGTIIGFYTIPSFLYPYAVSASLIFIFLLREKRDKHLFIFILTSILTGGIILGLYTPVFMVSGFKALVSNNGVKVLPLLEVLKRMPKHFKWTSKFLFYVPLTVFLIFILTVSLFLLLYKKDKRVLIPLAFLLSPPFILFIHKVIPFERTWIYLIVPFFFLIGLLIDKFTEKLKFTHTIIITSFFAIPLMIYARKSIYNAAGFSRIAKQVTDFLIKQKAKNVYVHHRVIDTYLIYYFIEKKADTKVHYRMQPFDEKELQKAKNCCDFFVIDNEKVAKTEFQLLKTFARDIHVGRIPREETN